MDKLTVLIEQDEAGFFVASCPALKGCWSQGTTEEEALANIREAIEGWFEAEGFRARALVRPGQRLHEVVLS
jgi:predicted RNase H-like HicB family nuclease